MRILLTGGGTGGSVVPLLAVVEEIPDHDYLFLGGKKGPEKKLAGLAGIQFKTICSGKLRRYFSPINLIDLFKIACGFIKGFIVIITFKPDVVVSAGSFVSVPIVWAAWLLRKKVLIHQQDIQVGLANKLMAPFAAKKTKAFEEIKFDAEWIGNPVRRLTINTEEFKLHQEKPVVLLTGGGTGAHSLNQLITPEILEYCQLIHLTGKGKGIFGLEHPDYYAYDLLDAEMPEALHKADLVITRAGLSTLTELGYLGKPAIVIPLPGTHQERNADLFRKKDAVMVIAQKDLTSSRFAQLIKETLASPVLLDKLSKNIKQVFKADATKNMAQAIEKLGASS